MHVGQVQVEQDDVVIIELAEVQALFAKVGRVDVEAFRREHQFGGEAGTIASTPAVVNAVVDALRPFGVNDVRMPCTPERVYKAIHAQDGAQSGGGATEGAASPHFDEKDTTNRMLPTGQEGS